jgi:hypothetical protein
MNITQLTWTIQESIFELWYIPLFNVKVEILATRLIVTNSRFSKPSSSDDHAHSHPTLASYNLANDRLLFHSM